MSKRPLNQTKKKNYVDERQHGWIHEQLPRVDVALKSSGGSELELNKVHLFCRLRYVNWHVHNTALHIYFSLEMSRWAI